MNRRRPAKPFVSGGVYDPQQKKQDIAALSAQELQSKADALQQAQDELLDKQNKQQKQVEVVAAKAAKTPTDADAAVKTEESENMETNPENLKNENGKPQFKKIFLSRKKSSVRAKEKKLRQNRQLRKAILPKNALMALNEVKGIVIGDFNVFSGNDNTFTAVVTVNGNEYSGKGSSKTASKNNACEKALRDYVLAKMRQNPRGSKNQAAAVLGTATATDTTPAAAAAATAASGTEEANQTEDAMDTAESEAGNGGDARKDEDDVPMINLASFAIFKLFTEWESEGFVIPELHPSAHIAPINKATSENGEEGAEGTAAAPKEPKKPTIRNDLPTNWKDIHPCTLLCMMRPGASYVSLEPVGESPNAVQRCSVNLDDKEYFGSGRSKKLARRNCAAEITNVLFNTTYTIEE